MSDQADIDAISRTKGATRPNLHVPEFAPDDPELWVSQLERQFTTFGISSQTDKYAALAGSLPHTLAAEVRDLVVHQPAEQPYDTLRAAILQRAAPSQERRIRQLLEGLQLGDRKPSQLLRQMRSLAGSSGGSDDSLLRQLWLQQLPATVQPIISTLFAKLSLDEVAEAADKAVDTMRPELQQVTQEHAYPSSSTASEGNNNSAMMLKILQGINQLTTELRKSKTRLRSRSRRRGGRSRSTNRSFSPSSGRCWYHARYGAKAHKCVQPCNFSKQEN